MTKLETLYRQMTKEQKRIEMLKSTRSNGDADWYDFVNQEIKNAKIKTKELQKAFDNEYKFQNSIKDEKSYKTSIWHVSPTFCNAML